MKAISKEEIFLTYPSHWVLISNTVLDSSVPATSVANCLLEGIPLLAGIDKKVVAAQSRQFVTSYKSIACTYTGKHEPKTLIL